MYFVDGYEVSLFYGNNPSCNTAQSVVVEGDRRVIVTPIATTVSVVPKVKFTSSK